MSEKSEMNRRKFIQGSVLGICGTALLKGQTKQDPVEKKAEPKPEGVKIKDYRTLGRTGFKASDIGCGGMSPVAVLNLLFDSGVNYLDSAESYGNGASETNIGQALKGRDRNKFFITTKLEMKKDKANSKSDILARFQKCLERLQTNYVDCLMLHGPEKVEDLKLASFHQATAELKKEGKIKYVGTSNHGSMMGKAKESMEQVLLAAAEDGRFDVFLMVYNFLQTEQADRVLKICKEKNIGVTLMKTNPVGMYWKMKDYLEKLKKEGKEISPDFQEVFNAAEEKFKLAEPYLKKNKLNNPSEIRDAAIRFALNNPQVHVVNIGFRTFDDVDIYLKLSGAPLTAADNKKLLSYRQHLGFSYCRHACGKCETACPANVPVNTIMRFNHYFDAQGREKFAMQSYRELTGKNAAACHACPGHCQKACPYGVSIQPLLALAHQNLSLPGLIS